MVHMASKISELPESLGSCTGLRVLSVDQCRKLKSLPEALRNARSLTHLDIRFYPGVKELPEWLADLPALELVWHPGVHVPPGLQSVAKVG